MRIQSRSKTFFWITTVASALLVSSLHAADHVVKMLNTDAAGNIMVYNPAVLKIQENDTITFDGNESAGHNAETIFAPKGSSWKSEILNKGTFTTEKLKSGTYIYICAPHISLGMFGIVQVGDMKINDDQMKKELITLKSQIMMNNDRIDSYRKQWENL